MVVKDVVDLVDENFEDQDIEVNGEHIASVVNSHVNADANSPESANTDIKNMEDISYIEAEI